MALLVACSPSFGFPAFFLFFIFFVVSVNGLYFPTAEVNFTLPAQLLSPTLPPPLLTLLALQSQKPQTSPVSYGLLSESTPGLLVVDGDKLRLGEEFFEGEAIEPKLYFAVVSARAAEETANATINLFFIRDKINCGRAKRILCFWDGASYQIRDNQPPTQFGQLSSPLFRDLCKNYSLIYRVYKGNDYVRVGKEEESGDWILFTKRRVRASKGPIRFGVECGVASPEGQDHFQREFNLTVTNDDLGVAFDLVYNVPPSNFIRQNERIAKGEVSNPSGGQLRFTLDDDPEGLLDLKCLPGKTTLKCQVMTKKSIHLHSPYTAYVRVEDTSSQPPRSRSHNITLEPNNSGLEKLSLMLSTNPEENFLVELKYLDSVEISRRAVAGTRVAEPLLRGLGEEKKGEARRKVVEAKIKFEMVGGGVQALNVTRSGGIVFVARRNELKESAYRIKVSGVYPNGYRFISTMQVNVTDTVGEESCEKTLDEIFRPSCSEKRFKSECERTCGVSSGMLKRSAGKPPVTSGCAWRSNDKPEKLSRLYQTCSPDFSTCPDRFCDPLEALFPKICPQDCTEYVFGSANKENHVPGIASATGVCSCDNRQKCLCALLTKSDAPKQNERRKAKEMLNDTAPRRKETISAVKTSDTDRCGLICLLSIVGGSLVLILGLSTILIIVHRRRLKKRFPNQRPLKEDMVNINYEEYVERPGDVLRPLTQSSALKEIPDYFDKKWEFPRHRLTIDETIGEGEFGRVLKARADGIGGHDGSITVAVKTLKDNAKDSELADLISEFQLLKEIDHPNVIHLLGACTKLDGPPYIIIEYAKHGSLRNYLRRHRHAGDESGTAVTPKDILTFAWQIAKGMSYLTEMKLVHRDLAARNVLVAEGLICKISDFGLTRDIYEDDTYLKRSKGRVPVKWMALESLADHVYTTKSDVWSYGVVLWELVTTGASPYPGIAGQDLFHLLKGGYRMERPPNCSPELYRILSSCWHESPAHRPTFKSLVAKLEEMLGEGKDYLDLNPRTAENKTYFGELPWGEMEEKGEREAIMAVEFKMFEKEKANVRLDGKAIEEGRKRVRYENEGAKGRYENEGMEDLGYVQPTGKPKPVGGEGGEKTNLDVDSGKEEMFDVSKIWAFD